ncbi:unnamed protein product [Diabrotica balteata]|uniref:Uncharacterized protein n=1 Tax=Diabrotica balteata TaxID=107213 RepID=A0A9N9TGT0_DIABA|nr:unnamed protein product [Diabrotica balteata]
MLFLCFRFSPYPTDFSLIFVEVPDVRSHLVLDVSGLVSIGYFNIGLIAAL